MKDYYYILGLKKEATLPEIQKAYKKLSLKFHPQENGNDPFFVMHFEKIKEAFDVLSDDHKRFRYDKALGEEIDSEVTRILDGPKPVIASFFASKKASKKGELLTISWEVLNAEEVNINLIGDVASNGTQTIRLVDESITQEFLSIEITASNNGSPHQSSKELKIKNLAYSPKEAALKKRQAALSASTQKNAASKKSAKKPNKVKASSVEEEDETQAIYRSRNSGTAYFLVAVMFFLIVLMLYTLNSINPMF